jgi:hypothetical protein
VYIDARKFKYKPAQEEGVEQSIARDKKFAEEAYSSWFKSNIAQIIERLWEIQDIGVAEKVGDFIKLLKEAEFTYSIGAYKSSIALIGISAEDLCRFFSINSGHNFDSMSQNDRIKKLLSLGLIDQAVADSFQDIRKLRNDCLHYNQGFKSKSDNDLKSEALVAINKLKLVYSKIVGVTDYDSIDASKLIAIIEAIAREASQGSHEGVVNINDALIRTRNILAQVTGIDLSVNVGGEPVHRWSAYKVDEIDISGENGEITLIDQSNGLPVIVDFREGDACFIKEAQITEGSFILASLVSVTNGLGTTENWYFSSRPIKIG